MNNEPNKPIPAQELTDKELEGISGGILKPTITIHGDDYTKSIPKIS